MKTWQVFFVCLPLGIVSGVATRYLGFNGVIQTLVPSVVIISLLLFFFYLNERNSK